MTSLFFIISLFPRIIMGDLEAAQVSEGSGVTISGIDDIADVVGGSSDFDRVEMSPDGEHIAWANLEQGLCIYSFGDDDFNCNHIPWDDTYASSVGNLRLMYLDWSPDNRYLTFAEYPFAGATSDSDIWIFDTETLSFTNVTEDHKIVSLLDPDVDIDYVPTWSPASNEIFFFRTSFNQDFAETRVLFNAPELWRVSTASAQPELVYTFDSSFDPRVFAASISPDGTQFAIFAAQYREDGHIETGLWTLNLVEGRLDQVATQSDFADVDLGWQQIWIPFSVDSLQWLTNPDALVLGTYSSIQQANVSDMPPYIQNFHYVDLVSQEVFPLIDYAQPNDEDGDYFRNNMPRLAIVCDDKLIYYAGQRHHASIYAVDLPFNGAQPVVIATEQDYRYPDLNPLSVVNNGYAVIERRDIMTVTCDRDE